MIGVVIAFRKSNETHWRIGLSIMDTIKKTPYTHTHTQVDLLTF